MRRRVDRAGGQVCWTPAGSRRWAWRALRRKTQRMTRCPNDAKTLRRFQAPCGGKMAAQAQRHETQRGVVTRNVKGQAAVVVRSQEPRRRGLAHRTLADGPGPPDKCPVQPAALIPILAVHSPFSVPVPSQRAAGAAGGETGCVCHCCGGSCSFGGLSSWASSPLLAGGSFPEGHSTTYPPGRQRPNFL